MIDFVSMGYVLSVARKQKRISQESVAEMAMVSVDTIRNIEHGYTIPRMETVFALWDIYGLPRDDIWNFFFRGNSVNEHLKRLGLDSDYLSDNYLLKM